MPTPGDKPEGDKSCSNGTFSYAQAAKGKPQPPATGVPPSKDVSGDTSTSAEQSLDKVHGGVNETGEEAESADSRPQSLSEDTPAVLDIKDEKICEPVATSESAQVSTALEEELSSPKLASTQLSDSSSTNGKAAASSTASKADTNVPSTNGTSETSIEEVQEAKPRSGLVEQGGEQLPLESDEGQSGHSSQTGSEAKEPENAVFKEAPPPPINFWTQRMAQSKAQSKPSSQAVQQQTHTSSSADSMKGGSVDSAMDNSSTLDAKRRGKGNGIAGDDRMTSGLPRERRPYEVDRANAVRVSRTADSRNHGSKEHPPPPPNDQISWPTPDNAQDEEKKRASERNEKLEKKDNGGGKVHGKEKWIPVEHVPTPVFNTPLPTNARRGGRPARGGREVNVRHTSGMHGHNGIGAVPNTSQDAPIPLDAGSFDRGRKDGQYNKFNSQDTKPRRASSASALGAKERRRNADVPTSNLSRPADASIPPGSPAADAMLDGVQKQGQTTSPQHRHNGAQRDHNIFESNKTFGDRSIQVASDRQGKRNSFSHESHTYPRVGGSERRFDHSTRSGNHQGPYHHNSLRERGEGRSERGRGGHRGGRQLSGQITAPVHGNAQTFVNGPFSPHTTNGQNPMRNGFDNYSQLPQSGAFPTAPAHYRSHRANSRSNSIQHGAPYGRFSAHSAAATPQLSHIHTEMANSMYSPYQGNQVALSAAPFSSYTDPAALCNMVSMQMDYYLSVDNLCKDMFLRKHMDSKGYILLGVLTNFNRIRTLTQDLEIIRMACAQSNEIEFGTGPDGLDRVRKRHGWETWVMAMQDRDPTARNDGPSELHPVQSYQYSPFGTLYGYNVRQAESARLAPASGHMDDIPYPLQHDLPGPSYPMKPSAGAVNKASTTQGSLSATVPEFSPQKPAQTSQTASDDKISVNGVVNGVKSADRFDNHKADHLTLLFKDPSAQDGEKPAHSKITNGDGDKNASQAEKPKIDKRAAIPLFHGVAPNHAGGSHGFGRSSLARLPSPRPNLDNRTGEDIPIRWTMDAHILPGLPQSYTRERYHEFRARALDQHQHFVSGKLPPHMDLLYTFWSHFLPMNFNQRMYDEFRQLALEDVKKASSVGMNHLIHFYDQSLNCKEPSVVPDHIANDFVHLIEQEESAGERRAFQTLRKNWRNGAWSMKNRSKITKLIDKDLATQLDS